MTNDLPVVTDRFQRGCADRKLSLFFPFSKDTNELFLPLEIARLKLTEFANAEAAGVDRLEQGGVSNQRGGIDVFVGSGFFDFSQGRFQ